MLGLHVHVVVIEYFSCIEIISYSSVSSKNCHVTLLMLTLVKIKLPLQYF